MYNSYGMGGNHCVYYQQYLRRYIPSILNFNG